jgi:hypothetical protein
MISVGRPLYLAFALFIVAALLPISRTSKAAGSDGVQTCQAPAGEHISQRFKVAANGENAPAYTAHVLCISQVSPEQRLDGEAAFASFDMGRQSVSVVVTCTDPIQSAKLLPLSYGLHPKISGSTVTFTVKKPGQVTLEVNGDWNNSLHIFANPNEADAPVPDDSNVIYYGPGVHVIDPVKVKSGQTVYIAAGAVIYGRAPANTYGGPIFDLEGSNIVLRGRGIIDGSLIPKTATYSCSMIVAHGSNIRVEGVTFRDSGGWNFPIQASTNVKVQNIKIFGYRGNSDGIDINNSANVDVSDCFFRTFDDDVVLKSSNLSEPDTHNVTAERCVMWNEIAHALSLGAELNVNCENIKFSNCDIIHDKGREWLLRVYDSGSAAVKNVTFDDIRIEEARRPMSLWIGKSMWVKGGDQGHIDNIVFSNISSVMPDNGQKLANFVGYDADHTVNNVRFENVKFGGKEISASDITENQFVNGVTVPTDK